LMTLTGATLAALLGLGVRPSPIPQTPSIVPVEAKALREYVGVYQWSPNAVLYLQMWEELTGFGKPALVAFDESGWVRTLYPVAHDQFFTGPGAALPTAVESRIEFQRDTTGRIASLRWLREGVTPRTAVRVEIEKREEVHFSNGDIQLAGTLISPNTRGRHPAIILVHGSGAENREFMLPYARFLIRHGFAVLGYDKRGVEGSTGDWTTASFEDLAGDVIAAFDHLKAHKDIDQTRIGLLGVSQAGWVMPIAAVRAPDIAFLVSVSGAAVSPEETTLDEARNEMLSNQMRPAVVELILELMRRQYRFARTNEGWDDYSALRGQIAARIRGTPPPQFPASRDDPLWRTIRTFYFYDPGPTLRRLRTPTLAIFGELDNNILAQKNHAAWDVALKAAGNRDYTLTILPRANHGQWEAKTGNNAEEPTLQGFVPAYFSTVADWLAKRVRGFRR